MDELQLIVLTGLQFGLFRVFYTNFSISSAGLNSFPQKPLHSSAFFRLAKS